MKLEDVGEFGFIDRVTRYGNIRPDGVVKAIGDDCAVIDVNGPEYLLVTTDLLVEQVHFFLDWTDPEIIGAKALTVNVSDIAACGGVPRDAFVSLAIPRCIEVEWLDGLYRGMGRIARDFGVNLLGGDTTASKGHLVINVALTGSVPKDQVLFRHTACVGDAIVLTGPTGKSAAGCDLLLRGEDATSSDLHQDLIQAHLQPRAHVKEGRFLAASAACTAAIDVSDGLSSDLLHLCRDSGVGAILRRDSIPVPPELVSVAKELSKDPWEWILDGGEDYVLLAAVRQDRLQDLVTHARAGGWNLLPIGQFVTGDQAEMLCHDGTKRDLRALGWNHFR